MSSYRSPAIGATFLQFLNGFVQSDGLPFCEVLTAAQIEQAAAAAKVSFGAGADDVYSVPLTLWAFITQVVSDQKSCVAAVARAEKGDRHLFRRYSQRLLAWKAGEKGQDRERYPGPQEAPPTIADSR